MRHASAKPHIEHLRIQVRMWHMPDTYLLCVNVRAAGFREGFGKVANRIVIGRCIVCCCPAKLGDAWKEERGGRERWVCHSFRQASLAHTLERKPKRSTTPS